MMVRLNSLHKKFLAVSLGVSGLIIIRKLIMSEHAHCLPGEICESKPPHDWKLQPYNGLDEDHPVRRRFLEERNKAANDDIDSMSIRFGKTKKPDNFLYEMFATQQETKERVITKTEIKVKEVYLPQPCETDLKLGSRKYIRNCITNEIIGKIPSGTENVPFDVKEVIVLRKLLPAILAFDLIYSDLVVEYKKVCFSTILDDNFFSNHLLLFACV